MFLFYQVLFFRVHFLITHLICNYYSSMPPKKTGARRQAKGTQVEGDTSSSHASTTQNKKSGKSRRDGAVIAVGTSLAAMEEPPKKRSGISKKQLNADSSKLPVDDGVTAPTNPPTTKKRGVASDPNLGGTAVVAVLAQRKKTSGGTAKDAQDKQQRIGFTGEDGRDATY